MESNLLRWRRLVALLANLQLDFRLHRLRDNCRGLLELLVEGFLPIMLAASRFYCS
jgi:hypothetical protein